MYIAEIKGKLSQQQENQEDILTSNVFSLLKYAPREVFLHTFLNRLGFKVSREEAKKARFHFWPGYEDRTEPDLVIVVGSYYLLFEAKLHSGFGKETEDLDSQLRRELDQGQKVAKQRDLEGHLIAVTAHYSYLHFLKELTSVSKNELIWVNWHRIGLLLEEILESKPDISREIISFANDLHELLLTKNLRRFSGIDAFFHEPNLKPVSGNLFFDPLSADYRDDFMGFKAVFSRIQVLNRVPKKIFYQNENIFSSLKDRDLELESVRETIFFQEMTHE